MLRYFVLAALGVAFVASMAQSLRERDRMLARAREESLRNERIVVLTGYASIATAIEAIKLGATHYLAKPTRTEEILAAFKRAEPAPDVTISEEPMGIGELEWEHIQKILVDHQGNISATAKALGMHRRTLQRKLSRRPGRR